MPTGWASLGPQAELDAGWDSRARGVGVPLPAWLGPTHLVTENLFSNLSLAHPPPPTSTTWQDVPPGGTQALASLVCTSGPLRCATSGLDFNSRIQGGKKEETGGGGGAEWIPGLDPVLFLSSQIRIRDVVSLQSSLPSC